MHDPLLFITTQSQKCNYNYLYLTRSKDTTILTCVLRLNCPTSKTDVFSRLLDLSIWIIIGFIVYANGVTGLQFQRVSRSEPLAFEVISALSFANEISDLAMPPF
jgi:hypothetical protein